MAAFRFNSPTATDALRPGRIGAIARVCASIVFFCAIPLCGAADLVTNLNDSGAGSLRQSVAFASPGDSIEFAPGLSRTIVLGSTLVLSQNVSILGNTDVALDGNDSVPVLEVGSAVQASLDKLTIQHGLGVDGGGIRSAGTLTLTDCVVADNHATHSGGGIFIASGSYLFIDTLVSDNEAVSEGGGLFDQAIAASSTILPAPFGSRSDAANQPLANAIQSREHARVESPGSSP